MGKIIRNGITLASFNYEHEDRLITKSITANDTYNASDDNADGYSSVTVSVPEPVLITKNITSNDTYNAEDDNADGYSSVTVSVASGNYTDTIFDGTLLADKYINNSTGAEVSYNGWSATDYLDVEGISEIYVSGGVLSVSSNNKRYNAWYYDDKTTYSTFSVTPKLTVPSGVKYLRLSCPTADITGIKLFTSVS